jgi:hypothetical protein
MALIYSTVYLSGPFSGILMPNVSAFYTVSFLSKLSNLWSIISAWSILSPAATVQLAWKTTDLEKTCQRRSEQSLAVCPSYIGGE